MWTCRGMGQRWLKYGWVKFGTRSLNPFPVLARSEAGLRLAAFGAALSVFEYGPPCMVNRGLTRMDSRNLERYKPEPKASNASPF